MARTCTCCGGAHPKFGVAPTEEGGVEVVKNRSLTYQRRGHDVHSWKTAARVAKQYLRHVRGN